MSKRRVHVKQQHAEHDDSGNGSNANGAEHVETALRQGGEMQGATAEATAAESTLGAGAGFGGFLSRLVYTASYTVSYGVVFPVMFVAYSVPTENALVRGLVDGGRAACDAVAALYDESAHAEALEHAQGAEPVPA